MNLALTFFMQFEQSLKIAFSLCSYIMTPITTKIPNVSTQSNLQVVQMLFPNVIKQRAPPCIGCLRRPQIPSVFKIVGFYFVQEGRMSYFSFRIVLTLNGIITVDPTSLILFNKIPKPYNLKGIQTHSGIVKSQICEGQTREKVMQRATPLMILQIQRSQRANSSHYLSQTSLYLRVAMIICCPQNKIYSEMFHRQWVSVVVDDTMDLQLKKGRGQAWQLTIMSSVQKKRMYCRAIRIRTVILCTFVSTSVVLVLSMNVQINEKGGTIGFTFCLQKQKYQYYFRVLLRKVESKDSFNLPKLDYNIISIPLCLMFEDAIYSQPFGPHFGLVMIVATMISIELLVIAYIYGAIPRKVFSEKFMNENFGQIHRQTFKDSIGTGGHPDTGSGFYSQKLSYKQWWQFNNRQRVHLHFVEWIATYLFLLVCAGSYYPVASAWIGLGIFIVRIWYTLVYVKWGPKARLSPFMVNLMLTMALGVISILAGLKHLIRG